MGGFTIGDAGTPHMWEVTNNLVWQDTLAWIRGRHSARFGVELKRSEVDDEQPFSIDGLLIIATFDDFLLGQSAAQNGSPFGLSNVTLSRTRAAACLGEMNAIPTSPDLRKMISGLPIVSPSTPGSVTKSSVRPLKPTGGWQISI